MNGIELFERMKTASSAMELIDYFPEQGKKGNTYEKLWSNIILFGFCPNLSNDIYDNYEGNVNTCNLKKVDDIQLYLTNLNVLSKGLGGSSDITLQNKNTGEWIFISCKFFKDDDNKSIDKYDIQNLVSIKQYNQHKYKEYKNYLFVKDKKKVQNLIENSQETSNYITDNIYIILDVNDLEICFKELQNAIKDISFNEINSKFCNTKIPLELRFHQDLITYKQLQKIEEGEKELLLGAKARSGKTYCVGGLFLKYNTKYNTLNCLIITPAPTETLSQFTDDLFHKFKDYIGINIVEIRKGTDFNDMILQDKNIIIVSKQLLDDYVCEKKVDKIKNLKLDFIVFDENHFHGTTQMAKDIFTSYSSQKTIKLYLTATYAKPLNEWNIPMDCRHYWDIEDEQLCKKRNIHGLIEKHGQDVERFVNDSNKELILAVYDKMPDLHIITNMMDRKRYDIIKDQIKDTSYGFSNGTLLSTTKNGSNFKFIDQVDTMLEYITGHGTVMSIIPDKKSIFERIKNISNESNSRTKLNKGDFTTQLWFLPFGHNMLIDNVSKCLKDRMLKNHELKNYEILIVNSKKDYKVKNIKEEIKNKELKAKEEGKVGLIILAGNQLTLGITLPFVDIVFLFNDILSSDKIVQMMYRCMTETINTVENDKINSGKKHFGFVVDLNISRVLNTLLDYNVYKKDLNLEQKIMYLVENNLINIDSDLFQSKENKTELVEKLMNIWKTDPINNLKMLLRKIEEQVIEMDTKDQKILNQHFSSSIGDGKVNVKVEFDDNSQELQNGKVVVKNSDSEPEYKEKEEDTEAKNNISLTKDILPFIIPLSCILTMKTDNVDFMEMLNIIKTNPELLCVFNDQSFIWWNKKDIIVMIEKIVQRYIQKNSSIYNIAIQFKMSLHNLIDNPKELLELIDSCLKPKQLEKKKFGEVFTPMTLVNEMIDKLDVCYTKTYGKSIFVEKDFKWFDSTAGMGNFPISVYLKLMEGLKIQFPLESERKKHILENMLYMSELNKKNVFIINQIFNISKEYKMNLYEGDSLLLDTKTVWDITHFDVILGNPPYQDNKSKNGTLWDKFITKSLKNLREGGYLVYIHPSGWRNVDGKFKKTQKELLLRDLQYLEIHNEKDGIKTFSSETRYDWYILRNIIVDNTNTIVKFQDGTTNCINVNGLEFIPNGEYNKIMSMIANTDEEHVEVMHSESLYEIRKKWMSRIKNDEYKYPCVYTVNSKSEITHYYSSKQNGHYGIPKFIWSNGRISSIGSYVDDNGDYGLTQFAYAIVDEPENLQNIKTVFDSKEFRNLMELCAVGQLTVNYKVISLFKNDFWKYFNKDAEAINETINESIITEVEPKVKKTRVVKPKPEESKPKVKKTRIVKPKTESSDPKVKIYYHDEDIMSPF